MEPLGDVAADPGLFVLERLHSQSPLLSESLVGPTLFADHPTCEHLHRADPGGHQPDDAPGEEFGDRGIGPKPGVHTEPHLPDDAKTGQGGRSQDDSARQPRE